MKVVKSKATRVRRAVRRTRRTAAVPRRRRRRIRQTLTRLHVVAVRTNTQNTPHNSAGWRAIIEQQGVADQTATFDSTGVARFNNITTLTNAPVALTIEDAAGNELFTRTYGSGREVLVARFA
ncbi:hypothetical protein [Paenibacillus nanensis]|nr:hypothetical protein [Paenibacillus nanensis]